MISVTVRYRMRCCFEWLLFVSGHLTDMFKTRSDIVALVASTEYITFGKKVINIETQNLTFRDFFLRFTQYNTDAHNTHAHSPLWIHVRKPYPYEHLRRTEHRQIWRFSKSPLVPRRRRDHPGINPGKGASTRIWTLVGSVPLDRPTIRLQAQSHLLWPLRTAEQPRRLATRFQELLIWSLITYNTIAYCWHSNLAKANLGQADRSDWVPKAVWPGCAVVGPAHRRQTV
jgi:hypothetical protein